MSRKYYFFFRLFLNAELTLGKPCVNSDIFIFSEKLHIIRIFFSENPNFPFFFWVSIGESLLRPIIADEGIFYILYGFGTVVSEKNVLNKPFFKFSPSLRPFFRKNRLPEPPDVFYLEFLFILCIFI